MALQTEETALPWRMVGLRLFCVLCASLGAMSCLFLGCARPFSKNASRITVVALLFPEIYRRSRDTCSFIGEVTICCTRSGPVLPIEGCWHECRG